MNIEQRTVVVLRTEDKKELDSLVKHLIGVRDGYSNNDNATQSLNKVIDYIKNLLFYIN